MKVKNVRIKKTFKKTRKSKNTISKNFVKKVQKVISKNNEDKEAYLNVPDVNYNSGISANADTQFILPQISKTVNENGRIGEKIRCKKFTLKGHMIINMTNTSYSGSRIVVRLMIIQPKAFLSKSAIYDNYLTWQAYLLRKGGTSGAFTGAISDLYAPINSEAITTYYDKKFYFTAPYAPVSPTGNLITDPHSVTKFLNMSFKVKNKTLKYDDAIDSGVYPTNFNPCILLGYVKLDNASPDTITTAINMSYQTILNYEDS